MARDKPIPQRKRVLAVKGGQIRYEGERKRKTAVYRSR